MATIDRLIEDLRAEGSVDSHGRFTLDREQARAKMQKFQLVDARRYVLELVQAALLRDATHVEFEIDADDMRMRFDGAPFVAAEIDDLYGSLFADGDDRRLRGVRQLAIALNAALGMNPKHIHMRSGTVELRMCPGQPDQIIKHDRAAPRTEIHVRQRLRARVLFDFLRNLTGRMAEEQYLRARCLFASVPVSLDGKQISFGLDGSEQGLGSLLISGPDYRGIITIVDRPKPCELRLVKDGVWIDTRELPECGTHLIAVIEGDNLRKDVSQAKIVADATLERIELSIRQLRWKLWKDASDQRTGREHERVATLIREQVLAHASFQELQEIAALRELSTNVAWLDCRGGHPRVSLRELVELAAADQVISYSTIQFPELTVEGDPIPHILDEREVDLLERALERRLLSAERLLDRDRRRELGRQAWLARAGEPKLPIHIDFAVRQRITLRLTAGLVRGELGIDPLPLASGENKAPLHLLMYKDGCLLGRTEIDCELPGLWMAIDGPFEPNDNYTDAQRSATFAEIFLHALASFRASLGQSLVNAAGVQNEPIVRGLVKRWLSWLLDPQLQTTLLTRAGVDKIGGGHIASELLLPGLLAAQDPLGNVPLFEQLAGPRLSLAQLGQLIEADQKLEFVDGRPKDERLVAAKVLVTGPGDRKILRGLFGEQRLVAWDYAPKLRELEFWASSRSELAAARANAKAQLDQFKVAFEDWLVDLSTGPTRGFVTFFVGDELRDSELETLALGVRHNGRELCNISLASPFGPLLAVIEHPNLQPTSSWDDVVRDAAFEQALATVHTASRELFRLGCAALERTPAKPRRWLARVLLHGAARDPELRELAEHAPMLTTVDGRTLSLAYAAAQAAEQGKLEFVGRDVGFVPISDPPIIVAEESELDDIRALLGDVLVDAEARVRHHRVYDLLESRPALREAKLDPSQTWVRLPIRNSGQVGEIGLSRIRSSASLVLRLGVAGREVDPINHDLGFGVPVDAIVIDEELPLDARGQVDAQSKRIKTLIRQCRRRVPELILALCERWPSLAEHERASVWQLLTRHVGSEGTEPRRAIRERAFTAAAAIRGFRDVRGQRWSLAELVARPHPIEVLTNERHRDLVLDLPTLTRPILLVDDEELACLQLNAKEVRSLDHIWEHTLASLRSLASAPEVETPNIHEVAIAYRKATASGGLQCELWIPRQSSLLDGPELIFAEAGRELARGQVSEVLPSAGIIRGEGLVVASGELQLGQRMRSGVERQLMILYTELANRLADDQVSSTDRPRALEYLSWAAARLDSLDSHGKHALALRRALDRVVPPSLRVLVPDAVPEAEAPEPPAPELEQPEPPPQPVRSASEAPRHWHTRPASPEQRLLAAVYEQLHWARDRHRQLDELLLNRLELRSGLGSELARPELGVLALNREHPIVARLLAQQPHDPIDLAFLLAGLYSRINYDAEEISDDDERSFVAQLAEALAVGRPAKATIGAPSSPRR